MSGMRLVRYQSAGETRIGALLADGSVVSTPWPNFETIFALPDPLGSVEDFTPDPGARVIPDRLLAPTVDRAQVIGTGGNYADHSAEAASGGLVTVEPVFMPYLWGAIIGPDDDIVIPTAETLTDYEVELSIVIERTCKHVTEAEAMDVVFGYTVVNDVSAREVMVRELMQVMLSKSVDTFLPVGPAVVTRNEIDNLYNLSIGTTVNGEVKQHSNTGNLTVRVPQLLAAITRTVTLHAGDILTTGTPAGVGHFRTPPEYLRPGDTVTVEVEGVGKLTNKVVRGW
jgi:2-keto-4-pentenoate hydratase/2-oxohepta-3-ene-1,7-dioic acid hydratase in catechol pathway